MLVYLSLVKSFVYAIYEKKRDFIPKGKRGIRKVT